MISRTPEVTCMVVDVAPDDLDVEFTWYVDDEEKSKKTVKAQQQLFNSTYRVVHTLPIMHQDWLKAKVFKCKVNNKAIPAPIERTISKAIGGEQTGGPRPGAGGPALPLGVTICADLIPQGKTGSRRCTSWAHTRTNWPGTRSA
ncbi:Ig gamma chain C region [Myotis davidii]|uniref:Ig gamma chain C region n=1 Tax=Myotis davidii TaxID=225400 RepID=L5LDW9_MYODS|nr:Ig gamma chain C region [Myotis davidii]